MSYNAWPAACLGEEDERENVEVTPEMVAAGLEAYWSLDHEHDLDERIVEDVYRAMAVVALNQQK